MEFTEWMLWKAGAILIVVAVVQFWRGLTGQLDQEEQFDQAPGDSKRIK